MRTILILALLIATLLPLAFSARQHSDNERPVKIVKLCDVTDHAGEYHGKTVEVTGTYATAVDGTSFFDGDCDEARATFSGDAPGTLHAFEKIDRFMEKHKTSEVRITVVAVFRDDYASNVRHVGIPPYTFEVKRLVAISALKSKSKRGH